MHALLFLGLTTAFFQYSWPFSGALFLFAKLIGKTKQAEALCQGQCEEIQPTHDGVNQCHGSQSGCLALLKQACGGPDEEKNIIKNFFLPFLPGFYFCI